MSDIFTNLPTDLRDLVRKAAIDHRDHGITIFDGRGRTSERRSYCRALRARHRLPRPVSALSGIGPGEPVMVALPTSWEWLEAWMGLLFCGALPVASSGATGLAAAETQLGKVDQVMGAIGARHVVTSEGFRDQAATGGFSRATERRHHARRAPRRHPDPGLQPPGHRRRRCGLPPTHLGVHRNPQGGDDHPPRRGPQPRGQHRGPLRSDARAGPGLGRVHGLVAASLPRHGSHRLPPAAPSGRLRAPAAPAPDLPRPAHAVAPRAREQRPDLRSGAQLRLSALRRTDQTPATRGNRSVEFQGREHRRRDGPARDRRRLCRGLLPLRFHSGGLPPVLRTRRGHPRRHL